jgi:hypothetical protein
MSDDLLIHRARHALRAIAFSPPPYATDLLLAIADSAEEAAREIERDPARDAQGQHLARRLRALAREARALPPQIEETADGGA